MISVTNLHFSEIEGSGPKSILEIQIEGEMKNTRCGVGGESELDPNFQLGLSNSK